MLGTFNEYFKINNCAKILDFQRNFYHNGTTTDFREKTHGQLKR